jgi:branched-chain amino acid transport system substrate-binding protein
MLRRSAIALASLALVVAACGADDTDGEEPQSAEEPETAAPDEEEADPDAEPIRIGVLMPMTGFGAAAGEEAVEAWQLYWEQHDYMSGRTPIEVVYADDESDASAGVAEARRLVESENIDLLVGPIVGSVAGPVSDLMAEMDIPQIYGVPTNDLWIRDGMPDTLFTIEATTAEMAMHIGRWAAEEGGYGRVATVCSDYLTGWEACGGFVNTFTTYGGEIVEQIWTPAGGAPDYAPVISRLQAVEYDALYMGTPVGDGVLLFSALSEFGLADETQILSHKVVIDPGTLGVYGPEAEGILSSAPYAEGRDNAATQEFVAAFEEAYGRIPGTTGGAKYFIAHLVDTAIQELGGTIPSTADFIEKLYELQIDDSVYGTWHTDENGNSLHDHFLRHVVDRGDGTLWNVVEETWPGRGPGYVFDLDAYLAQPPYSQDYQGIGWPTSCDDFVDEADCPADLQ